jgi:hypothetical protein
MKTATPLPTIKSAPYCSLYDQQPKPQTHLAAHWLKDKNNQLYCCWVQESINS